MLKCPFHLPYLDALMTEFPQCTIVWTHRDPVECIASACSLYETLAALCIEVPTLDRKALGQCVLEYTYLALTRAGAALDALQAAQAKGQKGQKGKNGGQNLGVNVLHIRYADNITDPVKVCREVLAQAGMRVRDAAVADDGNREWEERVGVYLANNKQQREGKKKDNQELHSYCLEDYGLSEARVREHFRDYTDRYNLVTKKDARGAGVGAGAGK